MALPNVPDTFADLTPSPTYAGADTSQRTGRTTRLVGLQVDAELVSDAAGQILQHHHLLTDARQSTRLVADAGGSIIQDIDYDAYGRLLGLATEPLTRTLYTGHTWDADHGVYHMRARQYDPTTLRFTTRDPFDGSTSNPQSFNPYAYVLGDPVNLSDPTGQISLGGLLGAISITAKLYSLNLAVGGDRWGDRCDRWRPLATAGARPTSERLTFAPA